MTAVEYVGRHRSLDIGHLTVIPTLSSNYEPKHAAVGTRGTVYLVVTGFRSSIAGTVVSGYLLADTGELLATREASSIFWLERDLIHKAYRRLSELYAAWDVTVVPRDGEVPAEVEALRHEHMRTLGGVS